MRLRSSTSPNGSMASCLYGVYAILKQHFTLQLVNRKGLTPFRLLFIALIWLPPYFFYANYLEAYLLPLRLLCYTQPDLLSKQPISKSFDECVNKIFGGIRQVDTSECHLDNVPEVLIRPELPKNPHVILVIRTGPGSIDYRNFIRNTWKPKVERYFPVVFVCATSPNHDVLEESKKYKDILQFNFEDSYHNLSWKMMSIYGLVLDELPSVQKIVVINDDTIVNATALNQVI
ncbi:hypothetical protein WR25_09759 [Diploscapter pachys]|uniref:Hexosyltransferase n=1 Tax=Diploscapter pachys TaxID=2018661 RepID=A0A2A2K3G6_9BILA|nr:hypothetical protein WR25_09759 [Diploscapter pachys]